LNRFSDSARFIAIKGIWLASIDITEIATTSAAFTANKKCRLFIFPTFKDIWTGSLLADSV
jgi:hypothetical protein